MIDVTRGLKGEVLIQQGWWLYNKRRHGSLSVSPPHYLHPCETQRDYSQAGSASPLILDSQAPGLWVANFCSLSHSVYRILLQQPELTSSVWEQNINYLDKLKPYPWTGESSGSRINFLEETISTLETARFMIMLAASVSIFVKVQSPILEERHSLVAEYKGRGEGRTGVAGATFESQLCLFVRQPWESCLTTVSSFSPR